MNPGIFPFFFNCINPVLSEREINRMDLFLFSFIKICLFIKEYAVIF